MKRQTKKNNLRKIYNTSLFLFFCGVLVYSSYNILTIKGFLSVTTVAAYQQNSDNQCPTPTDRPTPTSCQPTPTPTQPCKPTPTSTVILTPTPTSGDGEASPTPNPTATPTSPPSVGGGDGGGGGGGSGGGQVCGSSVPTTPTLNSVSRLSATTVSLQWSTASPVNHYSISYGLAGQRFQFGVTDTGNVTSFIIGGLTENQNYCFAVAGVNDCMPGALSNTVCIRPDTGAVGGNVLGASTLGATGSSEDLMKILFIIGSVCLGLSIKQKYHY